MLPRLVLPPSHAVLALIALAFVAPGLVGHDPWRAFDVIAIEVAHQMHLSGDWIVPRVAGEPWLEDPPFYHWLALAFGKVFGGPLGFHNAARIASGAAMLIALWTLYLAARHSAGPVDPESAAGDPTTTERRGAGAAAMLLLLGSTGLIVHAHEAVPDIATLAAACGALCLAFLGRASPLRAGLTFGAALGIAFLSTGVVAPAALGAAVLLAHLVCDEWRTARAGRFLGAAALAFALVAASWPAALALRAPELAATWWQDAIGARGEFLDNLGYYLSTASWFAWPAWPLAVWSAWVLRAQWRTPRVFVPLAAALLMLPAIAWAGPQQDINTMLLVPPLAMLGAHGVARLRRGAANSLDWFGVMTFTVFSAVVWLGYVALMTGWPPRLARYLAKTAPGFTPRFELLPFALAVALTLAWLYLLYFAGRSPWRGVTRWAAGVALLWGCFAMLMLPWADHLKSYRNVALQLKAVLPADAGCVSARGIGLPQRAAFSYHAGIRTEPVGSEIPPACRFLIVQGKLRTEVTPGPGWSKLADVGRPGDKGERFRLYRYGTGRTR
jgi:4-amino-4-deoxy-L-arabinose transferase-like glycosyltransferase